MKEIRVIAPTGCLGYGFSQKDFLEAVDQFKPHFIAVDAGSTDPGPYYLGAGVSFTSRAAIKEELRILIRAVVEHGIPLIVGTAGGSGGRPHVVWTSNIVREIAADENWHFPMATIDAEIDRGDVLQWLAEGRIKTFESSEPLSSEMINTSERIVAQMGTDPIIQALSAGAQVIICGRACDDAIFAAYPIMHGFDPGLSLHMGKVLECGALASEPISMDVMLGTLRSDHFILEPGASFRACTVTSVSSHSLYERENPIIQAGPNGMIDLSNCKVQQESKRSVRVSGTTYRANALNWVKLEGVRKVGYRTISIAGVRCPSMIANLDTILEEARRRTDDYLKQIGLDGYTITFHVYGRDGVMRNLEPLRQIPAHDLGIVMDVVAPTQEQAKTACHQLSGTLLHLDFPGQYNNAGNLSFLYSPSEINVGPVYTFSVYHLAQLTKSEALFPVSILQLKGNQTVEEVTLK